VAEHDPFAEFDALRAARRSAAAAEAPALVEHDDFAAAHAAFQDLEAVLREVRRNMALEQRPATAEEYIDVLCRWEIARAHYVNNEEERALWGWAADDLESPTPWWTIEAELMVRPEPPRQVEHEGEQSDDVMLDGRALRWAIPNASFWHVFDQRVKRGKLATVNALSEQTRRARELAFIGRTRVKELVTWIDNHPDQAQRASQLHEIPAGFRATAQGVLLPRPPKSASQAISQRSSR
jgi:hypothetical protein